ncbi:MAG TPA: OmpA family protein [Acidimicrobiales bacterium]|nr:OmpA family protein [Acidimicrobiales bacterium]
MSLLQPTERARRAGRRRRRAAALVATLLVAALPAGAAPAGVAGTKRVPVAGTFEVNPTTRNSFPVARGAVQAVRRVPGGTVLYWSLGFPEGSGDVTFFDTQRHPLLADRWGPRGLYAPPRLVDAPARKIYTTLVVKEGGDCLCSPPSAARDEAGTVFVFYDVYAPLPPGTTSVSVQMNYGKVLSGIPVEDGPLEPALDPAEPIVLGSGWPRIDQAALAAAPDKQLSVQDLVTRVEDVAEHVTTVEAPAQVSLELSTDVLFAVDSAVLNPAAQASVAKAAATVNARAGGGVISVTGHTDDTGTDAHNDVLSLQRAQAVQAALAPLVAVQGVTYKVEGHGEREPVADNTTDAGRQANRRVTVAFAPKG